MVNAAPLSNVFKDAELGYQFTLPSGMVDNTIMDKQWVEERAAQLHTSGFSIRLSLRAKVPDTAADWSNVGIESYPRSKFAALSDRDAIKPMSQWVAGNGTYSGDSRNLKRGGFNFSVSSYELHEGSLTKHAHIYTTIVKGQLLSVAFSANSTGALSNIEDSMKTFTMFEPH